MLKYFLAAIALGFGNVADAQTIETVSSKDPAGIVRLLDLAGFKPKLEKVSNGTPKIDIETPDHYITIYLDDCEETTRDSCDSVMMRASFNRKDAWSAAEAVKAAADYRFASVYLDDKGDPQVTWDIVMGDGIPAKTFLQSVRFFDETLESISARIFPADGSQDTSSK